MSHYGWIIYFDNMTHAYVISMECSNQYLKGPYVKHNHVTGMFTCKDFRSPHIKHIYDWYDKKLSFKIKYIHTLYHDAHSVLSCSPL